MTSTFHRLAAALLFFAFLSVELAQTTAKPQVFIFTDANTDDVQAI